MYKPRKEKKSEPKVKVKIKASGRTALNLLSKIGVKGTQNA